MEILLIHGQLDQVIPFRCGEVSFFFSFVIGTKKSLMISSTKQETLRLIPWARFVEQGDQPGQVPTLNFGHWWYEYFDIQVWHDVLCKFLSG